MNARAPGGAARTVPDGVRFGLRARLIVLFVVLKVVPLVLLALLAREGIDRLGTAIRAQNAAFADGTRERVEELGENLVARSTRALDLQAREALERLSTDTAQAIADFLYARDQDIRLAATLEPSPAAYRQFLALRLGRLPVPGRWQLNAAGNAWEEILDPAAPAARVASGNPENSQDFSYRPPDARVRWQERPLFHEMSFVTPDGHEQVKVEATDLLPADLRDVSQRANTWCAAEDYFPELAKLAPGQIYVSEVIGPYVGSHFSGAVTPASAAREGLPYAPELEAWAGPENPLGRRFRGLVRWATPVMRDGQLLGYVTLALDHDHLLRFTSQLVPDPRRSVPVTDAGSGNYAFLWDYRDRAIAHPRHQSIVGFDPATGERATPWLDADTWQRWQASGQAIWPFLAGVPEFEEQSRQRQPARELARAGLRGLDCRYLNFAPQCEGFHELTQYGGSGSFVLQWSGVWKLVTAATIPYYTGRYAQTPRGFGYVSIGASVESFHEAAMQSAGYVRERLEAFEAASQRAQHDSDAVIAAATAASTFDLAGATAGMVVVMILIAAWLAGQLTGRITQLRAGLERVAAGALDCRLPERSRSRSLDEFGLLIGSINRMLGRVEESFRHLEDSEARYRAIFEQAAVGIAHIATDGRLLRCNAQLCAILHRVPGHPQALTLVDFLPADSPAAGTGAALIAQAAARQRWEAQVPGPQGEALWIAVTAAPEFDARGALRHLILVVEDIGLRKQMEGRLRLTARVFDSASEGIYITDADGTILDVNPAVTRLTGYGRDELIGRNPRIFRSGHQGPGFYERMRDTLQREDCWHGEMWNRHKDGRVYAQELRISAVRNERGQLHHYVALISDITERKQHQDLIEHLAYFDALTGLPNRTLLADRVRQALAHASRHGQQVAICYLDLDGFKPVNDRHGHTAGDWLLQAVALRLLASVRKEDTVARLGGDEFVLLIGDLVQPESRALTLERVLAVFARPFILPEGLVVSLSASIGVTLFPDDDSDPDTLLRHADQAMYLAKQAGRNRCCLFDTAAEQRADACARIRGEVRAALARHAFVLHWQPQVNMHSGQVIGAEALVRWPQADGTLRAPGEFLPAIEHDDLIIELGDQVIELALATLADWLASGLDLSISINLAARQLLAPDFRDKLARALTRHPAVAGRRIELEVVETAALEDVERVCAVIETCRGLGVRFALDDFGTGYSSLTYLKHLPAAVLKIDQSFVRNMIEDAEDRAIVEQVIDLGHALGRGLVAEGVETAEQGLMLLRMGCELAQGYGIARPMPAAQLPDWVRSYAPPRQWAGVRRLPGQLVPVQP